MQLAFTAKCSSGCISRQVGAVITDTDFSIKAVGWNDAPHGQVSCNLRDINSCCMVENESNYSLYENTNADFRKAINKVNTLIKIDELDGRYHPYCFKDIYNGVTEKSNQVHTRSLHAEENAFLQLAKYGGTGIKNGYLFTTASPCELCAKKAFQLGIKRIFYIDPYPGISKNHILTFGSINNVINPKMWLFYGIVGSAYLELYKPIMSYKDELQLISGISVAKCLSKEKKEDEFKPHYQNIEYKLEFINRESIQAIQKVDFVIGDGELNSIERELVWTGSSYDGTEIIAPENFSLHDLNNKVSPYKYQINFNQTYHAGENISYTVKSSLKDEAHFMHAYFARRIENLTDNLTLSITFPAGSGIIKENKLLVTRYVDELMKEEFRGDEQLVKSEENNKVTYTLSIKRPNLKYCYSIEWEWA